MLGYFSLAVTDMTIVRIKIAKAQQHAPRQYPATPPCSDLMIKGSCYLWNSTYETAVGLRSANKSIKAKRISKPTRNEICQV
jgi:hypothetical protein